MKKIFSIVAIAAATIMATSCSSDKKAEAAAADSALVAEGQEVLVDSVAPGVDVINVADIVSVAKEGKQLTDSDYTVVLDYAALALTDSKGNTEIIASKYPQYAAVSEIVAKIDTTKVGAAVKAKYHEVKKMAAAK